MDGYRLTATFGIITTTMPISEFDSVGPAVGEADITALEAKLGVKLPDAYRRFLLHTNGGRPAPENCFPFDPETDGSMLSMFLYVKHPSRGETILAERRAMAGRVPPDLLSIGYDMGGSLVCIGIEGKRRGKIYFWDMENEREWSRWGPNYGNVRCIADDFDAFIAGFELPPEAGLDEDELRWNGLL